MAAGAGELNWRPRCRPLALMFSLCSTVLMERIDADKIAEALLAAPGWARLGLTEPGDHLRRQSARELAMAVVEELCGPAPSTDPAQLALAL